MRHIIPISGKDSLCTALIQHQLEPELDYELMFNPTGSELPQVFEWLKDVEVFFDKKVTIVGRNLQEIIEDYNFFLPSGQARYCTRQSKIEPMEEYIGKDECFIYYGIRADEQRIGYINNRFPNIRPKYPLIDCGIGIDDVYRIINIYDLKPPVFFWESVYKTVNAIMMRIDPYWQSKITEWQFDMLFCWRTRANCYHCFFQRQYEWAGLYEHHPNLYWKAEWYEHQVSEYYWMGQGKPLKDFVVKIPMVIKQRVREILKILQSTKQQDLFGQIFNDNSDKLNQTTCGLFCGK